MERGFIFHLRYNIESLCLKKSEDTFLVGQDFCLNLREKTGVALVSIMRESFFSSSSFSSSHRHQLLT